MRIDFLFLFALGSLEVLATPTGDKSTGNPDQSDPNLTGNPAESDSDGCTAIFHGCLGGPPRRKMPKGEAHGTCSEVSNSISIL
jgi:hypothetical protein